MLLCNSQIKHGLQISTNRGIAEQKTLWEKCRELTATAKVPFVYLVGKIENNNEMVKQFAVFLFPCS